MTTYQPPVRRYYMWQWLAVVFLIVIPITAFNGGLLPVLLMAFCAATVKLILWGRRHPQQAMLFGAALAAGVVLGHARDHEPHDTGAYHL